jgi:hypothetical protein
LVLSNLEATFYETTLSLKRKKIKKIFDVALYMMTLIIRKKKKNNYGLSTNKLLYYDCRCSKPKTPCVPYFIPTELVAFSCVYKNAIKFYTIQTGNTDVIDRP